MGCALQQKERHDQIARGSLENFHRQLFFVDVVKLDGTSVRRANIKQLNVCNSLKSSELEPG